MVAAACSLPSVVVGVAVLLPSAFHRLSTVPAVRGLSLSLPPRRLFVLRCADERTCCCGRNPARS